MPRVMFNPFAKTKFLQHFQIKARALFKPLRFDEFGFALKKFQPFAQFGLDRLTDRRATPFQRVRREKYRSYRRARGTSRAENPSRCAYIASQSGAQSHRAG